MILICHIQKLDGPKVKMLLMMVIYQISTYNYLDRKISEKTRCVFLCVTSLDIILFGINFVLLNHYQTNMQFFALFNQEK